jgi:hypothetical protein
LSSITSVAPAASNAFTSSGVGFETRARIGMMDVLGAARSVLQIRPPPHSATAQRHTRGQALLGSFRKATAMPAASAKLAPVSSSRAASTDLCAGEHSTIKARRAATGIVRGERRTVYIDDVRFYRPHFRGVEGRLMRKTVRF